MHYRSWEVSGTELMQCFLILYYRELAARVLEVIILCHKALNMLERNGFGPKRKIGEI